jgi:hypothetical protein
VEAYPRHTSTAPQLPSSGSAVPRRRAVGQLGLNRRNLEGLQVQDRHHSTPPSTLSQFSELFDHSLSSCRKPCCWAARPRPPAPRGSAGPGSTSLNTSFRHTRRHHTLRRGSAAVDGSRAVGQLGLGRGNLEHLKVQDRHFRAPPPGTRDYHYSNHNTDTSARKSVSARKLNFFSGKSESPRVRVHHSSLPVPFLE